LRAREGGGEIGPLLDDGHRDARRLEAKQARLRTARGSGEAGRIHMDERHGTPRERSLEQPVDEGRLDARRDYDELERARRRTYPRLEERRRRSACVGLGRREKLQRSLPLRPVGRDRLRLPPCRVEREHAPTAAPDLRAQNRAGRTDRRVEG
jgi:hypothetical protein